MPTSTEPCVAVIGDVVDSRGHRDRDALHRRLVGVLQGVASGAERTAPRVTVGDEFQVSLRDLPSALGVVWDLRVALLPEVDVRFGIGVGEAAVLDAATAIEDGPAWWAARRAIEAVKEEQQRGAGGFRRVAVAAADEPGWAAQAQAAAGGMVAVDALFAGLDEKDPVLLAALRSGSTQAQAGARVGIGQQSVSERMGRHGLWALLTVRGAWDRR